MAEDTAPKKPREAATSREDRLKAALKANMARRKAQARARAAESTSGESDDTGNAPQGREQES
ncbi:hypothetical protein ACFSUD_12795 [Sulfitobacter aestuarii]|uniref:Uncharacterized protein n=1 Tax=Sulfitobacter aestuarii TaxID=2161676 RepID=A0ABW5U3R5_9RHOB